MMQLMRRREAGESGFTLIELLVVIVILAILAAVVVFAVGGINNKGQASACSTDAKTLETAEEANFAQNSGYTTEAALVSAGFLHSASSLWSVNVGAGNTSYGLSAITGNADNCTNPAP